MKTTLLFLFLAFSGVLSAQHGGARLQIKNAGSQCYYAKVQLVAFNDTLVRDTVTTDDYGNALLLNLPVGTVHFSVIENGRELSQFVLQIQLYQLLNMTVYINELQRPVYQREGSAVVYVPGDQVPENSAQASTIRCIDLKTGPAKYDIEELVVTHYKIPLLPQLSATCVIQRQEFAGTNMPLNSQTDLFESRVGGLTRSMDGISVRGSRADGNYYYIDGVKVRGSAAIPHSAIDQVTIYTGGLPANYGDVTGGVIAIQTRSYGSVSAERNYRTEQVRGSRGEKYTEEETQDNYERVSADAFLPVYENMFLSPLDAPHSTFGTDVDRASWSFVRTQLKQGLAVPRDAVKLEEMINSFDYVLPEVPENKPMNISFRRMSCPWNDDHELVAVQLRAKDLPETDKRPPHNLVFLVDVSGSMTDANKLPLLKQGLISFVRTLNPDDRVSLVTYAGTSGVALQPTLCSEKEAIIAAIEALGAGGSTNGIGGIETAYRLASESFLPEGNNRIILATDGDFNVGISNPHELEEYISMQRGKGIYLTALGFGMGNYRNDILETLADRGDGNHFYISSPEDCKEVLERRLGNLLNLARDVKLNVEFNPRLVASYRLIGYENRLMPSAHFRDDTKDGGEIGYGHTVTAVYEIEPGKAEEALDAQFSKIKPEGGKNDLCKVSLRYKLLDAETSVEESVTLAGGGEFSEDRILQAVIAFGLEMRQSAYKGTCGEPLLRELISQLGKTEQELALKETMEQYLR